MTAGSRLGMAILAAAVVGGCDGASGASGAPDGRDHPHVAAALNESAPTMRDAAAATYAGALGRRVTLDDGEITASDGARVRLVPGFYATADLNGDGIANAAVVLDVTNAGASSGKYLAFLRQDHFHTISLGTVRLGDPVTVRGLRTDGRRVVVDLTRLKPTDEPCCPSQEVTAVYVFQDGDIVEVGPTT